MATFDPQIAGSFAYAEGGLAWKIGRWNSCPDPEEKLTLGNSGAISTPNLCNIDATVSPLKIYTGL